MSSSKFQKKAHAHITKGAIKDAVSKAAKGEPAPLEKIVDRVLDGDPWDGKKRLDTPIKSLRVYFTEAEIAERRIELEKRLSQTPHLRDQMNAAKDAAKAAKEALGAHVNAAEGFSAITKQGYQFQDVECIEVVEKRAGGHVLAVTYRTDTGEEVTKREATKDELQESIVGV